MYKYICFLYFFCGLFFTSFSQSAPLPKNHPIAIAAPHLPLLIKYTGQGIVFKVKNNKYAFDRNERQFKIWMYNYPDELLNYKNAIAIYLKHTQPSTLKKGNKQLYIDLKSQWLLIAQF